MKKALFNYFCACALLLFSAGASAQTVPWISDDSVIPFCMEDNPYGISYPAGTTSTQVPFNGGRIGCLTTTPAPAWFIFQIDQPGDMIIEMYHSNQRDIDFILWGPFSGNSKQDVLANVYAGLPGTLEHHGWGDRCSYSADWREIGAIRGAQTGEWYILLITNFSRQPGTINFNVIGGTATTTCDIIINNPVINNGQTCVCRSQANTVWPFL